jgi:hypothetical protein
MKVSAVGAVIGFILGGPMGMFLCAMVGFGMGYMMHQHGG